MSLLTQVQARYDQLNNPTPRAISHRPDLAGRVHISSQGSGTVESELANYADYATVYQIYVWVHKAVSKIMDAVSPLPVRVVDADGQALESHPVSVLFANANDTMSPADIWQSWVVNMLIGGEAFFEFVNDAQGRPVEIWPRRPDFVKVVKDQSLERLLFPRAAGYIFAESDDVIPPEDMQHSKFFNPLNAWRGLAPIAAVRQGITIDMFAQAWSKAFLKRGARPDYALIAPQGITATEREEYEFVLMDKFAGVDGWHKPIVLEDGITDIKVLSFPPKDIEWLEQRKFSRDEVGGVFGVPDEVMGYGRDTYENMDAAHLWFWRLTLLPLVGYRDNGFTHFFTKSRPMLQPGERVATDLTSILGLLEDVAPKVETAKELWNMGVPFDTIDERLSLGIGPIPGGQTGYLPFSLVPATQLRPPTDEDKRAFLIRAATLAGEQRLLPPTKRVVPDFGSTEHKAVWDQFVARLTPHERAMQRELKRQFQRQQNDVMAALREEQAAAIAQEIKQAGEIPAAGDLFDVRTENAIIVDAFLPLLLAAFADFGQAALDDITGGGVAFVQSDATVRAIQRWTTQFANDINTTTQARMVDELRDILQEAHEGGWSIPEIQTAVHDRISAVFDVRKSNYETERIARTEMVRVANEGAIEGMRQSGVVRKKAWLAALDDRTRVTHVEAHGRYQEEPIALDALFEVGGCTGQAPGQTGCAEEDIMCRCTVVSVIS